MNLINLAILALNASMFMIVLALGLHTTIGEMTYLFRRPSLLLRSILSMNVIMLAFAIGICVLFDPAPAIKIALVGLAVSPVPPILPNQQFSAGGSAKYVIGLLSGTALVSIVLAPLVMDLVHAQFGVTVHMPVAKVATIVFVSVLVPLLAGIAIRRLAPVLGARIAQPISKFATVLLIIAVLPMLFVATPLLWTLVGKGVLVALVVFTIVGLAVGHALGGPDPDKRTVLALATGSRHPGIALALGSINFPNEHATMAVVIFHLLIGALVALPYVTWRKRMHAAEVTKP